MAARIAYKIGLENNLRLETDYFGITDSQPNSIKRGILKEADKVFIMEENMLFDIKEVLRFDKEIICLNIQDNHKIEESYIEKIIREKCFPIR